ncbi:MAG: hypothetical protein BGO34_19210 [Bacteroidia bacterium 44-10]|nr:MAG: hypothetical protein BGO34_19210 [Bacteroidia bacterium 44-10]
MEKDMKNKLYISIVGAMLLLFGCQTPEDLIPSTANNGVNSISAFFTDEDGNILDENHGKFTATVTEGNYDIVIPVSYYYPESSDNQVTQEMLVNMRVRANLDNNVTISPSLLYLDLSTGKKHTFTVVDQMKREHTYTISAQIVKSTACTIEEFSLPELSISGIVNETTKTISLVSAEDLSSLVAEYKLSSHATISPDPSTTTLDYNEDQTFTVTAHDGTSKATYTVKKSMPDKISSGIRPGSAKILFTKKLVAELGAPIGNHGGIAATQDYIVISTRDNQSIVIHPKTGALLNPLDVSATGGGLNNMYNTADDGGNVLICNLAQNAGTFKIWRLKPPTGTPELFINWTENTTLAIGRKLSVQGDIDGNAIITAPLVTGTDSKFARWQVTDGVLKSQSPDIVTVSGLSWTTNVDVIYSSATNVNSDYFITRHGNVGGDDGLTYSLLNWINGSTNSVRTSLTTANDAWGGFLTNAVDYTVFNNIPYILVNYVNAWNWGQSDQVYLVNAGSINEFEAPSPYGNNNSISGALVWMDGLSGGYSKYNYAAAGASTHNGNGTGDVAFVQSADGFFLYVYFMFTNGYIVGVQFDCVDI